MRDRAAESVLLQGDETKLVLHGREARREASRATANDHHIEDVRVDQVPLVFLHGFDCLAALFDRVANEAHAAQFAGNENAGNVGLEILIDVGNIDPPPLGAKNQGDGVDRADRLAGAVPDAMRGLHQFGLAADQSENVPFGAGPDARSASDTFRRVDDGMQRRRLGQAGFFGRDELGDAVEFHFLARCNVDGQEAEQRDRIGEDGVNGHQSVSSFHSIRLIGLACGMRV